MTPKHLAKADKATLDAAAKRAADALRDDDGRDVDLPDADDLPDAPDGHLVLGTRRRA